MRVTIGQPPRPDLNKGGSIVIGDLSEEGLCILCDAFNAVLNNRPFEYQEQLLALVELGAGLGALQANGDFRPEGVPEPQVRPVPLAPMNEGARPPREEQS